ncbi:MAG: insulinase family protein [Treponema sp.]|nr:insulinase family protein [Treponema sp.]
MKLLLKILRASVCMIASCAFFSCATTFPRENGVRAADGAALQSSMRATGGDRAINSEQASNSMRVVDSASSQNELQIVGLANGIPLYIQNNMANRKLALAVIVQGGTAYLTRETSGLESALFSMMTYGSQKYNYDTLQQLAYKMNFAITSSVSREGAILSMSCIDYYFETVLPIFADAFLHPAFEKEQYDMLMTRYAQDMQRLQTDSQNMLAYEMTQTVFKNHPYAVSSAVRPYSIENITIENIMRLHERDMDARRIMIVAVGNFNAKTLAKKLNKTFGAIDAQSYELHTAVVPPLSISGAPVVITSEAASGTGYLEKVASGPSIFDDDMTAAALAATMYSQVLFNIVREKYGACYTPSASITPMRAGMSSVYIFKASDLQNVVTYEREAHDIFTRGFVIDGKNDDGTYALSPIADRLEGYKNQYINSFYASSVTNSSVASRIAYSLLMFGEPYAYDKRIARIADVSAKEVQVAFEKYWAKDSGQWFAVVGPADKENVQF